MKLSSFFIDNRKVSYLEIDGRPVELRSEPEVCKALCFTAEEDDVEISLTKNGTPPALNLQCSYDDGASWEYWDYENEPLYLTEVLDKVYVKAAGSNSSTADFVTDFHKFQSTGRIAASGNVNSLLEENDDVAQTLSLEGRDYCFFSLFRGNANLTQAPELPSTTLGVFCYQSMFQGCSSLVDAPELPATTLAGSCYSLMFQNCTSLTQVPELPATTLAAGCYQSMFAGCTSLTQAPELPATTLAGSCYASMFSNCTSLEQAPELPATTLAIGCYQSMFAGCTSLTQAPELPATTLAAGCYTGMFNGCTSLEQAPELPATTLAAGCYQSMFAGCTSLNSIKVGFTEWNPTKATSSWLPDNTGTFECPWDLITNTSTRSINTVPSNWSMVAV